MQSGRYHTVCSVPDIAAGKLAGERKGQRQRFPVILNLLGSRLTPNQRSYSSEVRARLKITVTVQRAHFARTFL